MTRKQQWLRALPSGPTRVNHEARPFTRREKSMWHTILNLQDQLGDVRRELAQMKASNNEEALALWQNVEKLCHADADLERDVELMKLKVGHINSRMECSEREQQLHSEQLDTLFERVAIQDQHIEFLPAIMRDLMNCRDMITRYVEVLTDKVNVLKKESGDMVNRIDALNVSFMENMDSLQVRLSEYFDKNDRYMDDRLHHLKKRIHYLKMDLHALAEIQDVRVEVTAARLLDVNERCDELCELVEEINTHCYHEKRRYVESDAVVITVSSDDENY
jgi:chromosome segregation ATPase